MTSLEVFLRKRKKTHIIFDFDETLFWLILPWEVWERDIITQLQSWDKKIYQRYRQRAISLSELQNLYVTTFGKAALELFRKNNLKFELTQLRNAVPNQELIDFIRNTKGYHFYIWSSNTRSVIEQILEQYGLKKKFLKMITRLEVALLKPETEGFKRLYDSSVDTGRYVLVGDSTSDEMAARKIGIDFFNVRYFQQRKIREKERLREQKVILN